MDDLLSRLQGALAERYAIERELGSGGAGIVFLAQDRKLDRKVALKVLRPELAESLGTERFLREIHISAKLSHPHVLSLIDSGEADGLLYYVMFYVAGESLRDRLDRESQLPVEEALRITREVGEALEYAHRAGVVHRDVKPENILLEGGHALVCDFGIASAIDEAGGDKLTRTGLMVGTPAYMSPEQATGSGADHKADLYSLACVLYEMLVGGAPFGGSTPQAMLARKSVEAVPSVIVVRGTVPVHVERAIEKALAPVPADRFASTGEFIRALEEPALTKVGWGRRLGSVIRTGAVVAVGGMALLLFGRSEAPDPIRTSHAQVTSRPGVEDSPSLSPDGQWVVYAADNGDQRDILWQDAQGQRTTNLTEDSPADDYSPAFSPDGEWIAFRSSRDGGGLFVMRKTGEAVRRVTDRGHSPTWSPDGSKLAYVMEYVGLSPLNLESEVRGLWVVDLDTGESVQLVADDASLPSWSPNGRWIAYTHRSVSSNIVLVPADGGESVRLTDVAEHDWSPTWSPDGDYLFFSSDRGGSMNLWRVPVDQERGRPMGAAEAVTTPSAFLAHPSAAGDGSRVAYSSVLTTQNVEMMPLDPESVTLGEPFALTTGSRKWSSPDPSPDGSMVAFYSRDMPEGDLYVVRRDGSGLRQLTGDSAVDRVPRWSPDGARIAYFSNRSGELQAWAIRLDGSDNRRITFGAGAAIGGWSPNGARMAVNAFPSGGFLLDTSLGWDEQTPQPLLTDSTWGWFVSNDWSADGTRLAGMFGYADEGVGYYDIASGEHVQLTDFGQWPVWLPDSRTLLFVSGGKAFYVVDGQTREVRKVYSVVRDVLGPPRLTDDGTEVVYSRRITEGDIWLVTIQ